MSSGDTQGVDAPRLPDRGWPDLERFTRSEDAGDVAEWWENLGADSNRFLDEGLRLWSLVFDGDTTWCKRRVINLRFIEERRGNWESSIDFTVPDELKSITLCDGGRRTFWVPLAMYRKSLLPITHMKALDERDGIVPTASSAISTQFAFAILMGLASRTPLADSLPADLLWKISSPNLVEVERASDELLERMWSRVRQDGSMADNQMFLTALRILSANSLVIMEIRKKERWRQRVIRLSSDGPIRVSRRLWEALGWRPLTVAPRVLFGGNALTYHMEIDPPSQVLVADSRLLFAWFHPKANLSGDHRELKEPGHRTRLGVRQRLWRWWVQGSLHRRKWQASDDRVTQEIRAQCTTRCWDYVTGSAEPMGGHIRASNKRLPDLRTGRDVYGVFQIFPQYMGLLPQFRLVALVNTIFIAALAFGLDSSLSLHRQALERLFQSDPETLVVIALAVVGIGGSMTIVPREHLLTTFVLRPWRNYLFVILALTTLDAAAILWFGGGWLRKGANPNLLLPGWLQSALLASLGVAVALTLVIYVTTQRIKWAETRGSRFWRRIGLRFRRTVYAHGKFPDERIAAGVGAESPPTSNKVGYDAIIEALFVDLYLRDESQRELGNRGVPPSIRHEPAERGI